MSVLKAHRSESKAEYINVANKIYIQTINFLSRLSSRYSRLVASEVSSLASEVLRNALSCTCSQALQDAGGLFWNTNGSLRHMFTS